MSKKDEKKYMDLLLVAVLLSVCAILFLVNRFAAKDGAYVVVRQKDEEIARYSLSEDGRYTLNGGSNILVVEGGCAWVSEANCPDKLCVRQGKISKNGQCITCLPNRITVTVFAEDGSEVELVS